MRRQPHLRPEIRRAICCKPRAQAPAVGSAFICGSDRLLPRKHRKADRRAALLDILIRARLAKSNAVLLGKIKRMWEKKFAIRPTGTRVDTTRAALALGIVRLYDSNLQITLPEKCTSLSQLYAVAAKHAGISAPTVAKLVESATEDDIIIEESNTRGFAPAQVPDGLKEAVTTYIDDCHKDVSRPVWLTSGSIRTYILDNFGVDYTRRKVSRLLDEWGYAWGKLRRSWDGGKLLLRNIQKRAFVVQLAAALKIGHVYFTDESYAHQHLYGAYSIRDRKNARSAHACATSQGKRLVFIHALGPRGLLTALNEDGSPYKAPRESLDAETLSEQPTALAIFPAKGHGNVRDYHKNFDSVVFMDWVTKRLIPAIKAQHPGVTIPPGHEGSETVTIVMDNAAYHCHTTTFTGDGTKLPRFNPDKLPRRQLIDLMLNVLVSIGAEESVTVIRGLDDPVDTRNLWIDVPLSSKDAISGTGQYRVTLQEMAEACKRKLQQVCPSVLYNDVEDALASAGNIRVIWAVPGLSEANPIEMVWSRVKTYAAHKFARDRTLIGLSHDLMDGMYTNKRATDTGPAYTGGDFTPRPDGADNPNAVKYINSCLRGPKSIIQTIINNDPCLCVGENPTIDNLNIHPEREAEILSCQPNVLLKLYCQDYEEVAAVDIERLFENEDPDNVILDD